jgi:hypothetical protein
MMARKKQERLDNQKQMAYLEYARLRYKLFSTEDILRASQYLASTTVGWHEPCLDTSIE